MSMASRAIFSNFFEEQWTQNHPQYLSGLSRALFPTTFLETAVCKFIGTKESVYVRKEFNSHRTGLGHQYGRRFIVFRHQYGRRDVMWKHSINGDAVYAQTWEVLTLKNPFEPP